MKFSKNERIAEKWLSAEGNLQFIVTQSLTDPPKFILYKIDGDEKTKIQTSTNPIEFKEHWKES